MQPSEALLILGLAGDPDEAAIKRAFTLKLREAHPDTALVPVGNVQAIKQAKDCLLSHIKHGGPPCPMCKGRGYIMTVPPTECRQCDGTGIVV